ncbi:F-type H+-transporting ATPase subunit gamma [Stella humosa]|uniref:ATP synthase gamma chain n=1 Tax=Stella humosa TaxID=94 RepID=A0A3N1L0R8_9PROT|nr:F0F1 ATP synthase subunit gamma [Stella humosa]ROP84629.1 F-type H+-transporting ATPase subunit gamma [Stella humosa]BBK34149.1 ATP synthase gamma chain [Stella humosa]
MPSLKDLRVRINSVKSTRKITSAMKMVAAAKLRRAQEQAEAARPFAERMERMLGSLAAGVSAPTDAPAMLSGTGRDQVHLLIVATADRGLCGAFNSSIVREARRQIRSLLAQGKQVKIFCVGRKGRDQLRREYESLIVDTVTDFQRPRLTYDGAARIAQKVAALYEAGEFDVAKIIYNRFRSAIAQIVTVQQLIPFNPPAAPAGGAGAVAAVEGGAPALYEYEPGEEEILSALLPRNLAVQVYRALLENNASEHGARMTAMDNATRNASDMIGKLTLVYNRSRQASITKELIEIISGAEAL